VLAAMIVVVALLVAPLAAWAQNSPTTNVSRASTSGTFLAARHAGNERDVAAAASYYRAALRLDPRNNDLLEKAFLALIQNGDVDEASRLAERVLQADKNNRLARLLLGVRAIKQKQYPNARQQLSQSVRGQITDLAATLLSSWTQATQNESKTALEAIDKLNGPEWYGLFKNLHAGLILDLTGQRKEATKHYDISNKIYERVPSASPMYRNAQIQRALGLDSLERSDEATAVLAKLVSENPNDLEAVTALGNVQRGRKLYAECADSYTKGIDTIKNNERANWLIYYFRGICNERAKQWPKAEADFKRALELFPDQPLVLNYLGYSWVDQGIHLEEGMSMIRRAVEQRQDDGYIVDSLGWAYYRIGNYEEAVKHLEQAVELKPEDPTINDHLGDAYWKIGRVLEAEFQWAHARDLKPEPEDLPKILEKIKTGLAGEPGTAAVDERNKKPGGGG